MRNSDCQISGELCLFESESEGSCQKISKRFFNAAFYHLIGDPLAKIPLELFEPISEKLCESSRQCGISEVCLVSIEQNLTEIPSEVPLNESNRLIRHCYKKPPHWVSNLNSYSIQFCNSSQNCSNNNCLKLGRLVKTRIERVWKAEKVIVYFKLSYRKMNDTLTSQALILEDADEIDRRNLEWKILINASTYYKGKKFTGCSFSVKDNGFKGEWPPLDPYPLRIRSANLTCDGYEAVEIFEDLEIYGTSFALNTTKEHFEGLCGHPGLECSDCLIDKKLFKCSKDKDCYKVGDSNWVNRNEKSYCSLEIYGNSRLCKRDQNTCPPDSLNPTGTLRDPKRPCIVDDDCRNMRKFTKFPSVNVTFYPHCFNGVCCARRSICELSEFPYGLPIEADALSNQKECIEDKDCTAYPDMRGTCVFDDNVTEIITQRREEYLDDKESFKDNSYGMCCYKKNTECKDGGVPFQVDLENKETCSLQSDCNPDNPPFKWDAYCSGEQSDRTCCKYNLLDSLCPDRFTPFRSEPACENFHPSVLTSGFCPKENGMCHKGYCCPKLIINESGRATPYHGTYMTESPCDPNEPLDNVYQWAFCDEKLEKVVVMGNRKWNGEAVEWGKERCEINRDCGHLKFVCVHKFYGIKYCVTPPNYSVPTNHTDLWYLTIGIFTVFVGIVLILVRSPVAIFR